MTGRLNQSLKRSEPTRALDSEMRLKNEEKLTKTIDHGQLRADLLEATFNLRMEVTESGCRVRVKHGWIDVAVVIIDEAALSCLIDQTVLQHVLATKEDRKPFVVADVLVLRDVDLASFLEDHFIVPLWIDALKVVSKSVVFTEKNNLENGKSWILVESSVTAKIASLLRCLNIARSCRVRVLWWPFIASAVLDQHSTAGKGSNWSILLLRVTVNQ